MNRFYSIFRRHNSFVSCWKRFLAVILLIILSSHLFLATWKSDFQSDPFLNSVHIRSLKNRATTELPSFEKEEEIDELVAHLHRKPIENNETLAKIMAYKPMDIDDVYLKKLRNDPILLKKWNENREKEYERRNKRVKSVCRRYNIGTAPLFENVSQYLPRVLYPDFEEEPAAERPNPDHFSLASSYQAMACFVNKVASSSLATAFLTVAGYGPEFTSPHSMLGLIKPRSPEEFRYANSTFLKFMFVRHPFDRLLSCYRDKMVTSPHWSLPAFRRHIRGTARQIISARQLMAQGLPHPPIEEKLAPSNKKKKKRVETISLKETTSSGGRKLLSLNNREMEDVQIGRRLLAVDLANGASVVNANPESGSDGKVQVKGEMNPMMDDTPPTFEEFLEYILSTDLQGHGYDSHWVPYWRHCTPCHLPYQVLGKLETAKDDFTYIWTKTGLDFKIPIPFVNGKKKLENERSLDLQTQYYSSLPRDLILRTFRRYRIDFEMFEYSLNEVLQKGGHPLLTEAEALSP